MKRALPLLLLIVLAVIAIVIMQSDDSSNEQTVPAESSSRRGLNRNPAHINYSRHARCRMDCRHIDEREVQQILTEGKINYRKSELKSEECKKKYAVEGNTKDGQKVRIIFAPCGDEMTVVTVIDLGKEWACSCE